MAQGSEIVEMMGGMRDNYKQFKRLGLSVLRLSVGEMSEHAEPFLIDNLNKNWVGEQVLTTNDYEKSDLDGLTVLTFGNLAYVALHHSDKKVREKAVSLIERAKSLVI